MTEHEPAARRARTLFELGRPKDALALLYSATAESPEDPDLLRMIGQSLLAVDDGRHNAFEAITALRQSLALDPNDPMTWRVLAAAYTRVDGHGNARGASRSARELDPTDWRNHVAVAMADGAAASITPDTEDSIVEAMALAPNEPDVYFAAGLVETAERRPRLAADYYRQTLRLDPNHAAARNNLALIQMGRGNLGTSASGLVDLLAEDHQSDIALSNLRVVARRSLVFITIVVGLCALGIHIPEDNPEQFRISQYVFGSIATLTTAIWVGVFWIRSGRNFGRFVRAIPNIERSIAIGAYALLLSLALIDVSIVTPFVVSHVLYDLTLVVLFFVLFIINVGARLPAGTRYTRRRG